MSKDNHTQITKAISYCYANQHRLNIFKSFDLLDKFKFGCITEVEFYQDYERDVKNEGVTNV